MDSRGGAIRPVVKSNEPQYIGLNGTAHIHINSKFNLSSILPSLAHVSPGFLEKARRALQIEQIQLPHPFRLIALQDFDLIVVGTEMPGIAAAKMYVEIHP